MSHQAGRMPFPVYDDQGARIGFACTCSCGSGIFQAGGIDAKDSCWKMLAIHMIANNPELRRLVDR
jgi:hypothetical protein